MNNLLPTLKQFDKLYYTLSDLVKITSLSRASLYVILGRLVRRKELIRMTPGVYILPEKYAQIDLVANSLYDPSYLSFESALARYGLLSQVPYTLTFATTRKTFKVKSAELAIEYRRIQPALFFGYVKANSLFVATPEKAFLDTVYFASFGKAAVPLEDLDVRKLHPPLLARIAKRFPRRTRQLLDRITRR